MIGVTTAIMQDYRIKRKDNTYAIKLRVTFNRLPDEFSRKDYVELAEKLNIPDKTAQNYITKLLNKGLIHRDKHDCYLKTTIKEIKDTGYT